MRHNSELKTVRYDAEAMRLLRLADTISSILCREPYDTMWFGMGNAKADRLIAARNAHLQAAQVHATLAGIQA